MRNLKKTAVDTAPIEGNLVKKTATKATAQRKTPAEKVMDKAFTMAGGVKVAVVPVSLITVEQSYQRRLRPKHVTELKAEWDIRKSNLLHVNYRDGQFFVVDGMHRYEAAKRADVKELNCQVYVGMSVEEEAIMFAEQNNCTLRISVHDKFRARVVGKDPLEASVLKMCQLYSINTDPTSRNQPGSLSALGTAMRIVQRRNVYFLGQVFQVIARLGWNTVRDGYCQTVLLAAENLLVAAQNQSTRSITPEEVVNKVGEVFGREMSTPKDHIRAATAFFPTSETNTEALTNYWKEKVLG